MSVFCCTRLRLYTYLQQHGFVPERIEPSRDDPGYMVYIFEKTPELESTLTQYFVKDCYSASNGKHDETDPVPTMIDPSKSDFGTLVVCAVRYCLGRRTYMPELVCNYVRPLLPYLDERTIGCVERDVRECKDYGMDCNCKIWTSFLAEIRQVMEERSISAWN